METAREKIKIKEAEARNAHKISVAAFKEVKKLEDQKVQLWHDLDAGLTDIEYAGWQIRKKNLYDAVADQIAIRDKYGNKVADIEDEINIIHNKSRDEELIAEQTMVKDLENLHKAIATQAIFEAERAADQTIIEAARMSKGVSAELERIPTSRTVHITIRTSHVASYATEGKIQGRQHGGPVGAGQSVIVGEAGPEIFTPGRSGSVTSNRSIPSAEEIGAAVARAMQRAPLVVPRDAVTDAVLGNSPSRQALAGYQ